MRCNICNKEVFPGGIEHECDIEKVVHKLRQEKQRLVTQLQETIYQGKRWEHFAYWLAGDDYEIAWSEFLRTEDIEAGR